MFDMFGLFSGKKFAQGLKQLDDYFSDLEENPPVCDNCGVDEGVTPSIMPLIYACDTCRPMIERIGRRQMDRFSRVGSLLGGGF